MDDGHEPATLGLVGLQSWLDSVCAYSLGSAGEGTHDEQMRARRALHQAQLALNGMTSHALPAVRSLLAIGLVRFGQQLRYQDGPQLPDTVINYIATEVIWPLVCARDLPLGWIDALEAIGGHDLPRVVAEGRAQNCRKIDVASAVAHMHDARWLWQVLDDLNDPQRGGTFVTAAAASSDNRSLILDGQKFRLHPWVFRSVLFVASASVGGVIGNRVDSVTVDAWEWIEANLIRSSSTNQDTLRPQTGARPAGQGEQRSKQHTDEVATTATPKPVPPPTGSQSPMPLGEIAPSRSSTNGPGMSVSHAGMATTSSAGTASGIPPGPYGEAANHVFSGGVPANFRSGGGDSAVLFDALICDLFHLLQPVGALIISIFS